MNNAKLNRRDWLKTATALSAAASLRTCVLRAAPAAAGATGEIREIGSRCELFVDHWLIERLEGAALKLHEPQLAPPMTQPADNLEYGTVIKDGDLFRLYTRDGRGAQHDGDPNEVTQDCRNHAGDTIDQVVRWARGADVSSMAGRPVCLRFVLQEADLFAIQFRASA